MHQQFAGGPAFGERPSGDQPVEVPHVPRVADRRALLDDASVQLITCAAVFDQRADLAIEAMRAGKDFMADKPGVTTFGQLERVRQAQRDIDLRPDRYTHYYRNEFPVRFHPLMDTRRWGPGERIVFEPYTKEAFDETVQWIAERGIFPVGSMGSCQYEQSIASLTP